MRIDKWLWVARFFKTRAQAARACELGRIESAGQPAKPAREVRPGDFLHIKNESGEYSISVVAVSEMRGPAAVAQTLYQETDAGRESRLKADAERKAMFSAGGAPETKPSKRDRREIRRFRGFGR